MYVKLSWRPEVDKKLSHNGCTAGNFDLPDHGFLLLTCSQAILRTVSCLLRAKMGCQDTDGYFG